LVTVDSTRLTDPELIVNLEDILYGGGSNGEARLPLPNEIMAIFDPGANPPAATGANAGTPGIWTPAGATPPTDVPALQASSVVASPNTPWATGEFVQTGVSGPPGEAHWDGAAWVAGVAP
jgi:hypothetical protein